MALHRAGLRWKLSAAIAVVSALVAVSLSLLVSNAARSSMLESARDVQDERLTFAMRVYASSGQLPFGTRLDDPAVPGPLLTVVARGKRATYLQYDRGGAPWVWAASPVDGKVMSLRSRFTDREKVLGNLDRTLRIGSVLVVASGTVLAVLIGGRLSRRLRKAAVAARKLAAGESHVRVRDAIGRNAHDETDELARAVDAMADTLQKRLEAERRVTADIAHELRTPVTGLVTAAELLPDGRPSELVRDRAQLLRTLIEDVLEVARLDGAAERADLQEVALGEFVRRRVLAMCPDAALRLVEEAHVTTDPRRLERILGNLLANARRHGRPPVEVTVQGTMLRVRDHGPGFPDALLDEGPSRFRTGASDRGRGHGLGLTIAAGQARVMGARLTFRNSEDGPGGEIDGAVAVLWLPVQAEAPAGCPPTGA